MKEIKKMIKTATDFLRYYLGFEHKSSNREDFLSPNISLRFSGFNTSGPELIAYFNKLNSKIEVVKRSVYDYKNKYNFRTVILFYCGKTESDANNGGDKHKKNIFI